MWWDETTRTWRTHPDCRCHGPYGGPADLCICLGLAPLDAKGQPLTYPLLRAVFNSHEKDQHDARHDF